MTCRAASANRIIPDAPIGLLDSTPPEQLTGRSPPSSAVAPDSTMRQPSPTEAKPRLSNHIGSYHENGTYISTASISARRSTIPA